MSLKQTIVLAVALSIAYAAGVVTGQTEKFELEGNMKIFGAGNGIIFTDGTKQTSAGVGSSNDVICPTPCVGAGEIAANAVGSAEIATGAVGASEVAIDSLTIKNLGDDSVGAAEIAAGAVGASEVAADSLTIKNLGNDSVGSGELAANAVGTSEVADNTLTSDDLADASVNSNEVVNKSLRLTDLAMTVVMNQTISFFNTNINSGSCINTSNAAAGAPANSFAVVFGVRLSTGAQNPGWTVEGLSPPSSNADAVGIRVCNYTGANAIAPSIVFSFLSIAQ